MLIRLNSELKSEEGRIDRVTKLFSGSPPLILGEAATDTSRSPAADHSDNNHHEKPVAHRAALPVTQLSEGDNVMDRLVGREGRGGGRVVGGRERAEAEAASFAHLTAGARDPHAAAKARLVRKVRSFKHKKMGGKVPENL